MSSVLSQFSTLLRSSQSIANRYGKSEGYEILTKLLSSGQDNNFVLLICGEFKRGKSSLVNALLKECVCPVADGIATSAVSVIKYGKTPKVTRYFSSLNGSGQNCSMIIKSEIVKVDSIAQFANGTAIDIDNTIYLEIEIPNQSLYNGLILIDTPGIGSLDPRHLFLTQQALPKADAFFFVTDTSEPMLTTELDFIKDYLCNTNKPISIILSKSDLVSRDELSTYKSDIESKVSIFRNKTIDCIPVSSTEWEEFNKNGSERRKMNSNCEEVLSAIESLRTRREESIEELFRAQFLEYISSIQNEIEKSIHDISSDTDEIDKESYRLQLEDLKTLRDMITNEDSEFRAKINSIIEASQEQVLEEFSKDSVLLSTDKLEEVLKDSRAANDDGDKYVINAMNYAIQSMGNNIDKRINQAITDVVNELKDYINNIQVSMISNGTHVDDEAILPITHTFSESFVNITRQTLPFVGVATIGTTVSAVGLGLGAGILGITSAAALPFIAAGIGVAAGLFYVVQSIKGTKKQEKLTHIRQQVSPRISIAMNEMRSYIQKRYSIFNKEVVKTLKSTAKNMTEQMQEKLKVLQDCEKNAQKKAATLKELQSHLDMIANLKTHVTVLNTNPFA